MGLTIAYTIRMSRRADVSAFLSTALSRAKKMGWKCSRGALTENMLEVTPHSKCDPVRLGFERSLTCEEFVKTSFAPMKAHVEVVEFLRFLEPLCKSLSVEDECEYWETGDKQVLKRHRSAFDRAYGRGRSAKGKGEPAIKFTTCKVTFDASGRPIFSKSRPLRI